MYAPDLNSNQMSDHSSYSVRGPRTAHWRTDSSFQAAENFHEKVKLKGL